MITQEELVRKIEIMEREIAELKRAKKQERAFWPLGMKKLRKKRLLIPLALLSTLAAVGLAMAADVPHTFGTGGVISATKFNENFTYIVNRLWDRNGTDLYYEGGNVGIGITGPGAQLEVANTEAGENEGVVLRLTAGTGQSEIRATKRHATNQVSDLQFVTDPDQAAHAVRMTIDEDGDVGIGTTDPSADLHVHRTDSTTQFKIYSGGGYHDSYTVHGLFDENAYWMTGVDDHNNKYVIGYSSTDPAGQMPTGIVNITTGGQVGIGTTSPGEKLEVNGNIKVNGTIVAKIKYEGTEAHGADRTPEVYELTAGPNCDAANRGNLFLAFLSSADQDGLCVCLNGGSETYANWCFNM